MSKADLTPRERLLIEQVALISGAVTELQSMLMKQNASILTMRENERQYKAEYERMHMEWTSLMRLFKSFMLYVSVYICVSGSIIAMNMFMRIQQSL